ALVLSVGRMLAKREKPGKAELLYGACIGIPNYGSARFLLLALGKLPTVMVYPVYNAAVILVIGLVGAFVFRERLTRQKLAGFGLILAALVLLNL
ncbi:MAG: hypothetical protein MJ075_03740, partial [Oscillospiraceae bacterium]|nr:hypothetical protein [Oscillospiraceae bacterium]